MCNMEKKSQTKQEKANKKHGKRKGHARMSVHIFRKRIHPEAWLCVSKAQRRGNEREPLVFQGVWETTSIRGTEKSLKKAQKKSRKGVAIFARVGYNIGVVC